MHTRRLNGNIMSRFAILLAALLGLTATPALAQGTVNAQASFYQHTCYLGDEIRFQIAVENADEVTPPDLSGIPGATFAFRNTSNESSTYVSIVNGKRKQQKSSRLVMHWVVTPNQPGSLVIPPLHVNIGAGQVAETNEARIRVLEPEPAGKPVLRAQVDEDSLYINQTTRLHVTWLLISDVQEFSFRSSANSDAFTVQPFATARQGRSNAYQIDIFGVTAQGGRGFGMLDGERHGTLEFDLLITPHEAGDLTLGPITVSFDERVSRVSTRRVLAQTGPITLHVRALPNEGKPDNFTGLLGTHAIETSATPTNVNVGDPIELTVTISGPEPMPGVIDGPDLADIPDFKDNFRLSSEGWTYQPGRRPGRRTFSTTIRATSDNVKEIPRIPLAFFDPGEGEYRIARSNLIPIRVQSVREITAADAVISSGPTNVSRDPLTPTTTGVWAIERGPAVLADTRGLSDKPLRDPVMLAALIAPPGFFAIAAFAAIRTSRNEDETTRRRRRALATARRSLRQERPAQAVRVYLAEAFGASPSAITGTDGKRMLEEAGIEDADALAELIAIHEAEHYAAGRFRPDTQAQPARVLDLLRRVDRSIRKES